VRNIFNFLINFIFLNYSILFEGTLWGYFVLKLLLNPNQSVN